MNNFILVKIKKCVNKAEKKCFHDKNVKNTFLWIVEECGHVVNVEKADIFNDYVIQYLHGLRTQSEFALKAD